MMSNVGKAEQGPGRAADGAAGSPDGGQHEAEVVGQGAWRVEGEGVFLPNPWLGGGLGWEGGLLHLPTVLQAVFSSLSTFTFAHLFLFKKITTSHVLLILCKYKMLANILNLFYVLSMVLCAGEMTVNKTQFLT